MRISPGDTPVVGLVGHVARSIKELLVLLGGEMMDRCLRMSSTT